MWNKITHIVKYLISLMQHKDTLHYYDLVKEPAKTKNYMYYRSKDKPVFPKIILY